MLARALPAEIRRLAVSFPSAGTATAMAMATKTMIIAYSVDGVVLAVFFEPHGPQISKLSPRKVNYSYGDLATT